METRNIILLAMSTLSLNKDKNKIYHDTLQF